MNTVVVFVFLLLLFLWFIAIIFLQLLNVYAPKFETGGKFWPIVHNSTIFSLILMHVIAIGIFGLKKLPLASSLIIPLPVLTLLFNDYCRKRFLPLFEAYPTEVCWHNNKINPYRVHFSINCLLVRTSGSCINFRVSVAFFPCCYIKELSILYIVQCLVKKDREDQHDPTMADFYGKLVTAYQDPALMPVQYSGSTDGRTSPLLHAANVWS